MRDYKKDNVRGILIILVIFGHIIETFSSHFTGVYRYVLDAVYLFHMPLFVMVSGMLFKSDGIIKRASIILILYVSSQLLMIVPEVMNGKSFIKSIYLPSFSLWFLLALAAWNIALSITYKYKYLVPLSIISSLAVGYSQFFGYDFSYMRIVTLYPFFVIGYRMRDFKLDEIVSRKLLALSSAMVMVIFVLYNKITNAPYNVVHSADSYDLTNHYGLVDLSRRAIYLIAAFFMSCLLYGAISSKVSFLTKIGKASLPVYLGQALVIGVVMIYLRNDYLDTYNPVSIMLISIISSFLFAYILGRDYANNAIRKYSDFIYRKIYR